MALRPFRVGIIPLREIIGNYNRNECGSSDTDIIPLREIIGNYNLIALLFSIKKIIPLREIIGNYNRKLCKKN